VDVDRLKRKVAVDGPHLDAEHDSDVRPVHELIDQVARHALPKRVAAAEDRHALRMGGEEQGSLSCRVARTDDVDVQSVRVRSVAARRAVRDPLSDEQFKAVDWQVTPRNAAGKNDRAGLQNVAAVEMHPACRSIDA
jgi:hypothetical protein